MQIEGQWIWDRGHPPAKTEIHPPRLVAIQRDLPAIISVEPDRSVKDIVYHPDFNTGFCDILQYDKMLIPTWISAKYSLFLWPLWLKLSLLLKR